MYFTWIDLPCSISFSLPLPILPPPLPITFPTSYHSLYSPTRIPIPSPSSNSLSLFRPYLPCASLFLLPPHPLSLRAPLPLPHPFPMLPLHLSVPPFLSASFSLSLAPLLSTTLLFSLTPSFTLSFHTPLHPSCLFPSISPSPLLSPFSFPLFSFPSLRK